MSSGTLAKITRKGSVGQKSALNLFIAQVWKENTKKERPAKEGKGNCNG